MGIPSYDQFVLPSLIHTPVEDNFHRPTHHGTPYQRHDEHGRPYHAACDLHAPTGSPIRPGWRGLVAGIYVWENPPNATGPYGEDILILHGFTHPHGDGTVHKHNWWSQYAHCSQLDTPKYGTFVDITTVIAHSGESGAPGQPHLHHELHLRPAYDPGPAFIINPAPGLEKIRIKQGGRAA
jgi:murein DD-endopeptidase MepM/ murein hydrolase activator NlpD